MDILFQNFHYHEFHYLINNKYSYQWNALFFLFNFLMEHPNFIIQYSWIFTIF